MNGESLLLSPASTIQSKGLRLTFCVLPLKISDVSGERLAPGSYQSGARDRAAGRRIECLLKVSLRLLEQTFS
jgi:hypothetical protein